MAGVLKSPVDLLFFVGIGTYVRARPRQTTPFGDRAKRGGPRVPGLAAGAALCRARSQSPAMTQLVPPRGGRCGGLRLQHHASTMSRVVNTSDSRSTSDRA